MSSDDVPARLDWHLQNWRAWMRSGSVQQQLGAPDHSAGFVAGGYSTDSDSMLRGCDRVSARAMDAMISSLTVAQSAAVNHQYLAAVYRFPRSSFEETFADACERLLAWMPRHNLF